MAIKPRTSFSGFGAVVVLCGKIVKEVEVGRDKEGVNKEEGWSRGRDNERSHDIMDGMRMGWLRVKDTLSHDVV